MLAGLIVLGKILCCGCLWEICWGWVWSCGSLIFSFIPIPCSFPCGSSYLFFFIFPPSTADVDGCDSSLCSHWSSCSISFETWIESILGYCPVRLCMTSSWISLNSTSISFAFLSILFILRRQPSFYLKKEILCLGRFFNLFIGTLYYSVLFWVVFPKVFTVHAWVICTKLITSQLAGIYYSYPKKNGICLKKWQPT